MQLKIEQQAKAIQYIKFKFRQKTGQQIVFPENWHDEIDQNKRQLAKLDIPSNQNSSNNQKETFEQALQRLKLPTMTGKLRPPVTTFQPKIRQHLVRRIYLHNYKNKGFTKALFKQFLNRISEMKLLNCLSLQNNGINDDFKEEIQLLLQNKRITRIDFSQNQMGKKCLQTISKTFQNIEWIDLSRNNFIFDHHQIEHFISIIKNNQKIYHIGIDLQDSKHTKALTLLYKTKTNLHSLSCVDSDIDQQSMQNICHTLQQQPHPKKQVCRLNKLDFRNCYIKQHIFRIFLKSLPKNVTLIHLQLASNYLGQFLVTQLLNILEKNNTLIYLGLSKNNLTDQTAKNLSKLLIKNQIIEYIDLSFNKIGKQGAQELFNTLSQNNDSIESFGKFQTNVEVGPLLLQKIQKALRINKVSKQITSEALKQESQVKALQITNKQIQALIEAQFNQYELVMPITQTNSLKCSNNKLNIWQFD